jgi:hypothetical protein
LSKKITTKEQDAREGGDKDGNGWRGGARKKELRNELGEVWWGQGEGVGGTGRPAQLLAELDDSWKTSASRNSFLDV